METMMSKFRIKMKLQGLELEIEGAREDASVISRNIGQQLTGLMRPVGEIVDGEVDASDAPPIVFQSLPDASSKKTRRKRQSAAAKLNGEPTTIDFKHSPEKFGSPKQQWKTAQKAMWLLYVAGEAVNVGELSTRVIVDTFNKHFRQAGTITTSNVTRDLGKSKTENPAAVGEDTTKNPSTWFLTDEGKRRTQALIAETLSPSE